MINKYSNHIISQKSHFLSQIVSITQLSILPPFDKRHNNILDKWNSSFNFVFS